MSYKSIGIVVGLFFMLMGGVKLASNFGFVRNALPAEGKVIEVTREVNVAPGGDFDTYLKVEFRTGDGQLVSFKDKGPVVNIGDSVEVLYNPANPSQARIKDMWNLWVLWLLAFLVGTAMFVWSIIILRSTPKTRGAGSISRTQ